ncbi:MAG: serine/threonine-protein kinase, partial [Myxococcota bacterium]
MGTSSTGSGYEYLFDLSKGGMGSVALAVRRDGRFTRLYAVKRLLPSLRDDVQAREMFLEEGRLAGLLHHPNVVGVTDVGEDEQGPYLVMDYVEGISARDLTVHARRSGVPLSIAMVCTIGAQTARGLSAAHELCAHDGAPLQLVHRDVSPHNILLGFDGIARIADFGVARAIGREHRTSTGVLKGKLGYMAPEMLQFHEPTAKTDLFALGVVLYEMLA